MRDAEDDCDADMAHGDAAVTRRDKRARGGEQSGQQQEDAARRGRASKHQATQREGTSRWVDWDTSSDEEAEAAAETGQGGGGQRSVARSAPTARAQQPSAQAAAAGNLRTGNGETNRADGEQPDNAQSGRARTVEASAPDDSARGRQERADAEHEAQHTPAARTVRTADGGGPSEGTRDAGAVTDTAAHGSGDGHGRAKRPRVAVRYDETPRRRTRGAEEGTGRERSATRMQEVTRRGRRKRSRTELAAQIEVSEVLVGRIVGGAYEWRDGAYATRKRRRVVYDDGG